MATRRDILRAPRGVRVCSGAVRPRSGASSAVRSHHFVVDRMAIAGYRLRLPGRLRSAEQGAPLVVAVAAGVVHGAHGQLAA
jgi:hypothetical protein